MTSSALRKVVVHDRPRVRLGGLDRRQLPGAKERQRVSKPLQSVADRILCRRRYLQMSGAPEEDGLVFVADSRSRVNAALNPRPRPDGDQRRRLQCQRSDFQRASGNGNALCDRLKAAREKQREQLGGRESERGSYVFGCL
jgi:hypothetical protein